MPRYWYVGLALVWGCSREAAPSPPVAGDSGLPLPPETVTPHRAPIGATGDSRDARGVDLGAGADGDPGAPWAPDDASAPADSGAPPRPIPPAWQHRSVSTACGGNPIPYPHGPPPPVTKCQTSADCTQFPGAVCAALEIVGDPPDDPICVWDECGSDADCTDGGVCECGVGLGGTNKCFTGDCRTDADCSNGGLCIQGEHNCCGNWCEGAPYHCTSASDTCGANRPCDQFQGDGLWYACIFNGGSYGCVGFTSCI